MVGEILEANGAFLDLFVSICIISPDILPDELVEPRPHRQSLLLAIESVDKFIICVNVDSEHVQHEKAAIDYADECEANPKNHNRNESHPDHSSDESGQLLILPNRHVALEKVFLQILSVIEKRSVD